MNLEQLAAELKAYAQQVWIVGATLRIAREAAERIALEIPPVSFRRSLGSGELRYDNGSVIRIASERSLDVAIRARHAHLVLTLEGVVRSDVMRLTAPARVTVAGRFAPLHLTSDAQREAEIHADRAERRTTDE